MSSVRFLHTNDLHGKLSEAKLPALQQARSGVDFYFDSGDVISASNLGVPSEVDPAWERLHMAGCDAGTIGNRETHLSESAFKMKLSGVMHPLLCCNIELRDGSSALPSSQILEHEGKVLAVIGVSVPMVTERMASKYASAYLWTDPIMAVQSEIASIADGADLVVLISHLGEKRDREIAELDLGINIIFGGHSHRVWEEPIHVRDTWLCQGGSHARYYGVYEWDFQSKELSGGLHEWH